MSAPITKKLVLLGESSVGKSSIVLQFVKGQFDDYRESTIGAAFLTQVTRRDDGQAIKFEIWDTAGQERYRSLAPMYYRNAQCAVVVYDVTSQDSFDKAIDWIDQLHKQVDSILICLAGNKVDLAENQREVATADAQRTAEERGLVFCEVSAKTNTGIQDMFRTLANRLDVEPSASAAGQANLSAGGGGGGGAGAGGACC